MKAKSEGALKSLKVNIGLIMEMHKDSLLV
jgi:hypothetical protein